MGTRLVLAESDDRTTWLTLNHPDRLNAFSRDVGDQLHGVLETALGDGTLVVVNAQAVLDTGVRRTRGRTLAAAELGDRALNQRGDAILVGRRWLGFEL
jgi:enoyl-CoA hydratase/carnithine racemase